MWGDVLDLPTKSASEGKEGRQLETLLPRFEGPRKLSDSRLLHAALLLASTLVSPTRFSLPSLFRRVRASETLRSLALVPPSSASNVYYPENPPEPRGPSEAEAGQDRCGL